MLNSVFKLRNFYVTRSKLDFGNLFHLNRLECVGLLHVQETRVFLLGLLFRIFQKISNFALERSVRLFRNLGLVQPVVDELFLLETEAFFVFKGGRRQVVFYGLFLHGAERLVQEAAVRRFVVLRTVDIVVSERYELRSFYFATHKQVLLLSVLSLVFRRTRVLLPKFPHTVLRFLVIFLYE